LNTPIWTSLQTYPGLDQDTTLQVHAPPAIPAIPGNPLPPLPGLPLYTFSISPYDTGHTHISWRGPSGQIYEVYDSLDFHSQDFFPLWQADITDASSAVTHSIFTVRLGHPFQSHYTTLTPAALPLEAQTTYQVLLDSLPQLFQNFATLSGSSSLSTTLPGVPNSSAYYRLLLHRLDSDDDGLPDEVEVSRNLNPYDPDTDQDGVTDPWDDKGFTGPIITEFMANSGDTLLDENEEIQDWIEIFNPTSDLVDLNGWHLSDKIDNLKKWTFPPRPPGQLLQDDPLRLAPGQSVLIFLSGNTRRPITGPLHADLKLSSTGESILLSSADLPNSSANDPDAAADSHRDFPDQRLNTSAGWALDPRTYTIEKLRYFFDPTPGLLNPLSPCDILTPAPAIGPLGGLHPAGAPPIPVTIALAAGSTPATQLHYTLDGSNPTQHSPRYFPPSGKRLRHPNHRHLLHHRPRRCLGT